MVNTSSTQNRHIPVMLMESLENLKIKKNGVYVDGTLGLGGHSEIILQQIDSGLLIGIDRDKDSIALSKKRLSSNDNFKLFNDSYQNLNIILEELKIPLAIAILYFVFQTKSVKKFFLSKAPSLFNDTGAYSTNGYLMMSSLFGISIYGLLKLAKQLDVY